ncbi:hypothetical protein ETB97_011265 [Aspergillus alliaceus]|uniref:Uncharacterized protein n=1 Tax=Petromyces alliaceus TaxID=209559 RepID=A0A8H6ABA0_PETAA|nr:hypothetical protein ETB97_011265 [Aspergillus burnettii]
MAPTTEEYPLDAPAYPSQKVAVIFPGPSEIKHIHTERLILRPFQLDNKEDAAGLFRTRCQQEVICWMHVLPLQDEAVIPHTYNAPGNRGVPVISRLAGAAIGLGDKNDGAQMEH